MIPRPIFLAILAAFLLPGLHAHAVPTSDGLFATFDTTCGEFTVKLEFEKVPVTVANFVGLVEGTQRWVNFETGKISNVRFYDGLEIPRVEAGILFQAGSPNNTQMGGPGYQIPDEFHRMLTHSGAGIISMANGNSSGSQSSDTAGSQFFVILTPTPGLDRKHAVFGSTVEGIDVVNTIGTKAANAVTINSVTITRNGAAAQAFDPSAWSLPVPRLERTPADLEIYPGPHRLLFPREDFTRYQLLHTADLSSWFGIGFLDTILATGPANIDVSTTTAGQPEHFFSVLAIDHTPVPASLLNRTLDMVVYARNPSNGSDIPPKALRLAFTAGPRITTDYANPLGSSAIDSIPPSGSSAGLIGAYLWTVELRRGKLAIVVDNFTANFPGYVSSVFYMNLSFRSDGTGTFTGHTSTSATGPFLLYGTFTIADTP